jgi:hypothetical protein
MSTWKAVSAVLIVFILGTVFGLVISLWIAPRAGMDAPAIREIAILRMNQRMVRSLALTLEQKTAISEIIADTRKQLAEIRKEERPRVRQIKLNAQERMRSQLNPAQQARFDEMIRRNRLRLERSQQFPQF